MQLHIFAYQADMDGLFSRLDTLDHVLPVGEVGLFAVDLQLAAHNVREVRLLEHQRRFV